MALILSFLPVIIFFIVIFLMFREVMTWYWKINKIVELLERIDRNIRKQVNFIQPGAGDEEKIKVVLTKKLVE